MVLLKDFFEEKKKKKKKYPQMTEWIYRGIPLIKNNRKSIPVIFQAVERKIKFLINLKQ